MCVGDLGHFEQKGTGATTQVNQQSTSFLLEHPNISQDICYKKKQIKRLLKM